jgi:hypothetical protein
VPSFISFISRIQFALIFVRRGFSREIEFSGGKGSRVYVVT